MALTANAPNAADQRPYGVSDHGDMFYLLASDSSGVPSFTYGTAYRALFQRARAVAGETVLVHGASGGVGVAAVQIARASGLTVIGTAGSEKGRELVAEQGAHHVVDHRAPKYLEQILGLTDGRGVDVILEMLANVNLGKDLGLLAERGRVVVIGSRGTVEIDPRATMGRDASILGMVLAKTPEPEMALAAGVEWRIGIDAERKSLEAIATPLGAL